MAALQPTPNDPVRVLIVDDSAVARAVIARIVDGSDRFVVAGAVASAKAALAFLEQATADIILLDVAMPGRDGLTALPDLLVAGKGARIVIVSSSAGDGAAISVQALAMGAADTMEKPDAGGLSTRFGRALLDRLDKLCDRPSPRIVSGPAAVPAAAPQLTLSSDEFDVVAIGASTGGIHALGQLLRAVPASFRLPMIVTQHLPASFMPYFAAQLAVLAGRPCDVAVDRMRIRPGRLIVAPGDAHLRCVSLGEGQGAVRLTTDICASGCMPSVDPMLASLADIYGPRLMAVILSGMGRDGLEGTRRVRDAGGFVVVQDQASSVVWGMPGAVAGQGLAQAVMPPDAIGRLIAARRRQ